MAVAAGLAGSDMLSQHVYETNFCNQAHVNRLCLHFGRRRPGYVAYR
jgi:hypothetical protein